jgi:hypothetical protein
MKGSVILLVTMIGTPTLAQSNLPQNAPAPSSHCQGASGGFLRSDNDGYQQLSRCARGDTVIIPNGSTSVVARVCDFTRAIVPGGGNVVCSYSGSTRPIRP